MSVAGAKRIRELLDWTPEFENLDTIVRHALAWEHKLMLKDAPAFREASPARPGCAQYPRFGLKKPDATGKEHAGLPPRRSAAGQCDFCLTGPTG